MQFLQFNHFLYMVIEMTYVLTRRKQEADLWAFVKKRLNYLLKISWVLSRCSFSIVQDQQHFLISKEID